MIPLAARAFAAFALVLSLVPAAAAEEPDDGTCDDVGYVVCAGANTGAQVTCTLTGTVAACSFTRGNIWTAFSPIGLSGSTVVSGTGTLVACLKASTGVHCSTTELAPYSAECSWIAILECDGDYSTAGTVAPVTLAMGQCWKVTIVETIAITAWVPDIIDPLFTVDFANDDEGAGEVCVLDDGRD